MQQSTMRMIAKAASLKLTFSGIAALIAGVLVTYLGTDVSVLWLVGPLLLLAANLAAAIRVDPRINRRPGLLVFHVSLLAIVLLVVYGRLAGFHGRVELMENQRFNWEMLKNTVYSGPWHRARNLEKVSFTQGEISVDYAPDIYRLATRSEIIRNDVSSVTVGDSQPYSANGYEFYTTSNKGFSALVTWIPHGGKAVQGAVHFPSFPLNEWNQVNEWQPPQAPSPIKLELLGIPRLDVSDGFTLNRDMVSQITLGLPGAERQLAVGEAAALNTGRLEFDGIYLWIGYEIRHEPATVWTFLAAAIGILALCWHFAGNYLLPASDRTRLQISAAPLEANNA